MTTTIFELAVGHQRCQRGDGAGGDVRRGDGAVHRVPSEDIAAVLERDLRHCGRGGDAAA